MEHMPPSGMGTDAWRLGHEGTYSATQVQELPCSRRSLLANDLKAGTASAREMLAALKAIRRWCDVHDHIHSAEDIVRNIRLVAADYLSRAGIPDHYARPRKESANANS